MSNIDGPCVEIPLSRRAVRARWQRRQMRRKSASVMANLSWHARAWYAIHRFVGWALIGDNGYEPRITQTPRPIHAFLCRRWVPEWQAYLDRQPKA